MTTPYPFVAGAVLTAQQLNDIQNLPISDKTVSYTLAVADAYKRTMMNSASATTITVNNSIFTVGDVIQVANKGAGVCTVTAGAGVTINTSGSLALAQYGGGYLLCLSASTFTFFNLGAGANYGTATGGTSSSITVGGLAYTLLTFTTDANLVVSKAGLFDVLLIGGGAGAGGGGGSGGGGGAGDIVGIDTITTVYLPGATYAVDVAAGGAGGTIGSRGLKSTLANLVAVGGGAGSGSASSTTLSTGGGRVPCDGASGGGSGMSFAGIKYQGFGLGIKGTNGGVGNADSDTVGTSSGGGGGSFSAGGNGSTTTGGAAGAGTDISSWLTGATYYAAAGGGGGGTGAGGAASNGGVAGKSSGAGNNATNYGSGGGGTTGSSGGNGFQGAVYVRFKV